MTTMLSRYFSLEEMTITQVRTYNNTPSAGQQANLQRICQQYLDPIRDLLGHPVLVSSGFRSPGVNTTVGGAANSSHLDGLACDFISPGYGTPRDICKAIVNAGLPFDQLILEPIGATGPGTWVHVGYGLGMRGQRLGGAGT